MSRSRIFQTRTAIATGLSLTLLAGCETLPPQLGFLQPSQGKTEASAPAKGQTGKPAKTVEKDVEAPDVFQASEAALWDGRPSLGGIWVAHPDVDEPERVMIRNPSNGKFVVGALFRREREIPGPRLQASSDAAAALGMLAGAPVKLSVTALRRETVEIPAEAPVIEAPAPLRTASLDSDEIRATALDPIEAAAAAIDAPAPAAAAPAAAPKPAVSAAPAKKTLDKPFVQIGIFSQKSNANRTADQMRSAGMTPVVHEEALSGKTYWRVVVGPAKTKSERVSLLKQVRETGFSDAYAVIN